MVADFNVLSAQQAAQWLYDNHFSVIYDEALALIEAQRAAATAGEQARIAELEAALAERDWRPISEAPKDGTYGGIAGSGIQQCRRRCRMTSAERRRGAKVNYIGAPAIFALELACRQVNDAFSGYGCYIVGSSLERPDWRDVDIRFIMEDKDFEQLFPDAGQCWEQDARWLLLTTSISDRLGKLTGLPVDFQIQPQTHANDCHPKNRHAIGLRRKAEARHD